MRNDALYVPQITSQTNLPPILTEAPQEFSDGFIRKLIRFQPCDENPWLKLFPSTLWADKCYFVSNEAPNDDGTVFNPLHALSLFFSQQQPSLHSHWHPKDPTIKQSNNDTKSIRLCVRRTRSRTEPPARHTIPKKQIRKRGESTSKK
ncbi:uncharacterized protein BYT42DRAFT_576633 [Radiomyces spectabilis]|uniref:uncharacterized protein n=1 Tax=Radiomyces spectabilis TaxID=64574 RepID=UPI00221F8E5E|nr:uncharacterized protein BYT42DRAFT_576633 [Radiomyces spectabilis]KAI8374511.1 hypothetical protein BYT42DRAFT_576633 [Radiomyces spectabilis]